MIVTRLPFNQDIKELKLLERDGWTSVGNNLWTHPSHHGEPLRRDSAVKLARISEKVFGTKRGSNHG